MSFRCRVYFVFSTGTLNRITSKKSKLIFSYYLKNPATSNFLIQSYNIFEILFAVNKQQAEEWLENNKCVVKLQGQPQSNEMAAEKPAIELRRSKRVQEMAQKKNLENSANQGKKIVRSSRQRSLNTSSTTRRRSRSETSKKPTPFPNQHENPTKSILIPVPAKRNRSKSVSRRQLLSDNSSNRGTNESNIDGRNENIQSVPLDSTKKSNSNVSTVDVVSSAERCSYEQRIVGLIGSNRAKINRIQLLEVERNSLLEQAAGLDRINRSLLAMIEEGMTEIDENVPPVDMEMVNKVRNENEHLRAENSVLHTRIERLNLQVFSLTAEKKWLQKATDTHAKRVLEEHNYNMNK